LTYTKANLGLHVSRPLKDSLDVALCGEITASNTFSKFPMQYEVAFLGTASFRLYVGSTVYLATLHLAVFFHPTISERNSAFKYNWHLFRLSRIPGDTFAAKKTCIITASFFLGIFHWMSCF